MGDLIEDYKNVLNANIKEHLFNKYDVDVERIARIEAKCGYPCTPIYVGSDDIIHCMTCGGKMVWGNQQSRCGSCGRVGILF